MNIIIMQRKVKQIEAFIEKLEKNRKKINALKSQISSNWSADEVRNINNAFDSITSDIVQAKTLTNNLVRDINNELRKEANKTENKG